MIQKNDDYKPQAYEDYTEEELYSWVHLLVKRSTHRANDEKKIKDLGDAKNYLQMLIEKVALNG